MFFFNQDQHGWYLNQCWPKVHKNELKSQHNKKRNFAKTILNLFLLFTQIFHTHILILSHTLCKYKSTFLIIVKTFSNQIIILTNTNTVTHWLTLLELGTKHHGCWCLLMPWLLKSPEHQQAWYMYWLCRTDNMHCYSGVNFIYLGQAKSKIWFKMWIHISIITFKTIQHVKS